MARGPGMHRISFFIAKLLLAYVGAGAALVMYVRRSNLGAHAHIPFSGFPGFLVWSPLAPALILSEYAEHRTNGLICLLVFGAVFGVLAWLLFRRPAHPAK